NPRNVTGGVNEAFESAELFIGVSGGHIGRAAVKLMAPQPLILTLATRTPEIDPAISRECAASVATGRSALPHQIHPVLACPCIFAGALAAKATKITPEMKLAAADAIASIVADELEPGCIVPEAIDGRVAPAVKAAVQAAAEAQGV